MMRKALQLGRLVVEIVLRLVLGFLHTPGWAPEKFAWGITAHSVINTSSYGLWKRELLSSVAIKCRAFTELDRVLIKDTRIFWHKNRRILIGYEKILSRM